MTESGALHHVIIYTRIRPQVTRRSKRRQMCNKRPGKTMVEEGEKIIPISKTAVRSPKKMSIRLTPTSLGASIEQSRDE